MQKNLAILAVTVCLSLAITRGEALAAGCGGGGGGGGKQADNRTPGQKAMDKRSKDNPNRSKSKNPPAQDPGLRPGNGPVSHGPLQWRPKRELLITAQARRGRDIRIYHLKSPRAVAAFLDADKNEMHDWA